MTYQELFTEKAFINNRWTAGKNTFEVINPATGEVLANVADLSAGETEKAVHAAHRAWPGWRDRPAAERSDLLRTWFNLITEHKKPLARIMTQECGKPLAESITEVDYGASFVEWFAEEAKRAYGDTIPAPKTNQRLVTIRQPVGVCSAITPWNFPLAMITRKVAPALAAGCTVVLRPASQTPLTALALAVLAKKAGLPAGVFQVVTGKDSAGIGRILSTHPLIRKLSFTGSTEVGRTLMEQAAGSIKKVSLELGGNAPFLVFDDADLDAAVKGAIAAKFRNSGQTCVSVNRFLIQDAVFDAFTAKLTKAVESLKTGNGLNNDVQVGPLINQEGLEKVKEHIADALEKGARLVTGGEVIKGLFYQPTILADVPPHAKIAREETFGPVCALFRFKTENEGIALANDTEFGLAAYFYSSNIHRCWQVAETLEAGMIGVNAGLLSNAAAPFGGIKQSGIGREGSKYGLEEYTELKYLCFGG